MKDSKQISSDKKALDLAEEIKELITLDRFNVVVISPEKYNALYVKFRNLNQPAGVGPRDGDREPVDPLAVVSEGALG